MDALKGFQITRLTAIAEIAADITRVNAQLLRDEEQIAS